MSRTYEELKAGFERIEAAQACRNLMGKYSYLHTAMRNIDFMNLWANRDDDILAMPWGYYLGIEGVRKVRFEQDVFNKINSMSDLIKAVVLVVFVLLVAVSLLVISNTIKLVLHARRREINIMKYIGATDAFVKTPFLIEGIIVGVVGAYISWLLTIQIYGVVQNSFSSMNIAWLDLSQRILNTNLIIGVGISCIACMISIKKYLDV